MVSRIHIFQSQNFAYVQCKARRFYRSLPPTDMIWASRSGYLQSLPPREYIPLFWPDLAVIEGTEAEVQAKQARQVSPVLIVMLELVSYSELPSIHIWNAKLGDNCLALQICFKMVLQLLGLHQPIIHIALIKVYPHVDMTLKPITRRK